MYKRKKRVEMFVSLKIREIISKQNTHLRAAL